jgi:hypothetical protein
MAFTAPATRATDFLITAAIWNAEHVDNINTAIPHLLAYKSANESLTSNTTLQDDDHLFFTMAASDVWHIQVGLHVSGGNDSNIALAFTLPSGSMMLSNFSFSPGNTAQLVDWVASGASQTVRSHINGSYIWIGGTVQNGATPGNFRLQWAQAASVATALVVNKGSTIMGVKLA